MPLLGGCVLVAGAGLGYVISEHNLLDGSLEAQVEGELEPIWASVRESMEILIDPKTELEILSDPRRAKGAIDLDRFEVEVQAYDQRSTRILLRADVAVSKEHQRKVFDYILGRLAKARREAPKGSGFSVLMRASAGTRH